MKQTKLIALLSVFVVAVASQASGQYFPFPGYEHPGLELTTTTDKPSYHLYEPVTIILEMHNTTDEPIDLVWTNGCFRGYVLDDGAYEVPDPMDACPCVMVYHTVPAGQTSVFESTHTWTSYMPEEGTHSVQAHAFGMMGTEVEFEVISGPGEWGEPDLNIYFEELPYGVAVHDSNTTYLKPFEVWGLYFNSGAKIRRFTNTHVGLVKDLRVDEEVHEVAVDVYHWQDGDVIKMTAFDSQGAEIGTVRTPSRPAGTFTRLRLLSVAPIDTIEWRYADIDGDVAIDNLYLNTELQVIGDVDGDYDVDLDDFVEFKCAISGIWPNWIYDFDKDGDVDLDDFVIFKHNFGTRAFPAPVH